MRAIIAVVLLLAGCATHNRDIVVPCSVPQVIKPVWAFDVLAPDANLFDSVQALLVEREERSGYEIRLEAAAAACR